jgi:hypothetical protein
MIGTPVIAKIKERIQKLEEKIADKSLVVSRLDST